MADERKQELIRQLAEARGRATVNRAGLSQGLHVGDRIKANLTRFRGVWLTGAVLTGLVLTKLPPRTKKVPVVRGSKREKEMEKVGFMGIGLAGAKMAFDLGKPFLISWLSKRLKQQGR